MSRRWIARYPAAFAVLLFCLPMPFSAVAQDDAQAKAKAIEPPQVLIDSALTLRVEGEHPERADLSWQSVLDSVQPAPWPDVKDIKPAAALSPQAAELVEQGRTAMDQGEVFRAVNVLRLAEELAPDHPTVMRALGFAYAQSGNLVRGASYLRGVVAQQRNDAEALLLLARHAGQAQALDQVLTYCQAFEEAKGPSLIADYYRAIALSRLGYTTAATQRLASVLEQIDARDAAAINDNDQTPALIAREIVVLKALAPQLRIEQGDLLLAIDEFEGAAKAYASVKLKDITTPHLLAARRAYLALRLGDQAIAIDEVLALLSEPDSTERDAQLVGYLLEQGVPSATLSQRIVSIIDDKGASLPRLIALSQVADSARLLEQISAWLSAEPVTPERLGQAVGLIRLDDDAPADAQPLADLLVRVASLMQQSPDQALVYARAATSAVDAPVTLLRAIRRDGFATPDQPYRQLLLAVGYERTDRRADAVSAYLPLLMADPVLAEQVVVPLAELQLALGQGEAALAVLGQPNVDGDWPRLELALRAMAAAGQVREAIGLIDQRIAARGKQLDSDVLRIELIAQMGSPQEACNLLLRLISSHPSDESLYRLGIDLVYKHSTQFTRFDDADRMRRAFLTRLVSNLPDSSLARISLAANLMGNPSRLDEAKQLLLSALKDQPDSAGALSLLVQLYDEAGEQEAADAMHQRYAQSLGAGISRALVIAERAIMLGEMERAAGVLNQALALDEQGILPGPAMTGDDAARLLLQLEAADPDRQTEALYLTMVRRFPDHANLNNGLGYRWAVEGKNLLQAKAMIQRALEQMPTSHSLLDSLAWVQYKLGEFEEAEVTQLRALTLLDQLLARFRGIEQEEAATIAILNDHMGDIYYKRGDERKAIEHWRVATKQRYSAEQMMLDPELRTLERRLKAKIDAIANDQPAPVAQVPGPESHGPEGHPADRKPDKPAPDAE